MKTPRQINQTNSNEPVNPFVVLAEQIYNTAVTLNDGAPYSWVQELTAHYEDALEQLGYELVDVPEDAGKGQ